MTKINTVARIAYNADDPSIRGKPIWITGTRQIRLPAGDRAMTPYELQIREIAPTYDPRHVEAYMRCEHGTLDHLTPKMFAAEVAIAVMCINEGGNIAAEALAKSYGF